MNNMTKSVGSILTGAAVTAAVGTAAYMLTGKSKKKSAKQLKKTVGKAVQAAGDIVDNISNMMG